MNYKKGIPRGYLFYFARRRLGYLFVISTLPPFVISPNYEPPFGRPRHTVRFLDCARNDRAFSFDRTTSPPFVISTNVEKSRSDSDGQKGIDRAMQ